MNDNFLNKFKSWFYLGTLILIVVFATHKLIAEKIHSPDGFCPPDLVPHLRSPEEVSKDEEPKEITCSDKELEEFRRQIRDMV